MKKKNKIIVLIQARSNSKRFYNKVLNNVYGYPLIYICYKRVLNSSRYKTIIATSNSPEDDLLVNYLKKKKFSYKRGNLENVLKRFVDLTKNLKDNDILIRLTADNPLVDKFFLKKCIHYYLKNDLNYFSAHDNVFNTPYGLNAELFRVKHLRKVYKSRYSEKDKEHVTYSIRKKYLKKELKFNFGISKKFKFSNVSIDHLQDLEKIKNIFIKNNSYFSNYKNLNYNIKSKKKKQLNSKLGVGAVQIGKKYFHNYKVSQSRANGILNQANVKNFSLIDTARTYGLSEKFIGNYLYKFKNNFKISSKLKPLGKIKSKEKTIKHINQSIFESLLNLRISSFDYFLIHDVKDLKNKYLINHLKKFLDCGVIKNLGVSIYNNNELKIVKKIKIINSLQIPFNIIDHRLIELLQNKKKYVIFIRSILLRGNIKNKKICFNNNKKITNQIQEIVKNYEKQNYIKFAVKFVKFFKKADFYLFGFNNIKQIKDIKNLFNQKPLNKNKIENFVKQIQKLNLKDKVDLRNWNN